MQIQIKTDIGLRIQPWKKIFLFPVLFKYNIPCILIVFFLSRKDRDRLASKDLKKPETLRLYGRFTNFWKKWLYIILSEPDSIWGLDPDPQFWFLWSIIPQSYRVHCAKTDLWRIEAWWLAKHPRVHPVGIRAHLQAPALLRI